jgi:hypothetical protein
VPTFAKASPPADLLAAIRAVIVFNPEHVGVVGVLAFILSDRVDMPEIMLTKPVEALCAFPKVPSAIWAPFYFVVWDDKICVA